MKKKADNIKKLNKKDRKGGNSYRQPAQETLLHSQKTNKVLFDIAVAVNNTVDINELYSFIHKALANIIDVTNFFIAIVDLEKRTLCFPYHIDEVDDQFEPITDFDVNSSLTGLVVSRRQPVLLRKKQLQKRAEQNGVWGTTPLIWMGVPLIVKDKIIGVMAIQSYRDENAYNEDDLQILAAVSHQIAIAIDRKRSHDELKKSEQRFRQLFEQSNDAIIIYDTKGRVINCNKRATKMLGFSKKPMLQLNISQLFTDHNGTDPEMVLQAMLKQSRFLIESRMQRADGSVLDVEISSRLVEEEHGRVVQQVIRDISSRKEMEQRLEKSRQQYIQLFNASVDAIVRYDAKGRVEYLNPAFTKMFGWTFEELKGKRIDFVPPEEEENTWLILKKIRRGEKVANFPTRRFTKDGRILDVALSVSSIFDDKGNNIGNVVIIRDETQRRKMEEELEKSRQQYIQLIDASADAIVRYDAKGCVEYINPAFTKMFGWTFEELKGKRIDFVPPEAVKETLAAIEKMKKGEQLTNFPTRRFTKDGRILDVALSVSSIIDENGENIGNVVIIRDETERRKMEKALEEAKRRAEEANRSKSEFLANMSHEIRTPMNAIMGMAGLLMDTELNAEQREFLAIIRQSTDALLSIINDILDFSKIEAGKLELEMLDFDLREALDEIISLTAIFAKEKGLELCYQIDHHVPALLIGDPGRLRQIILNLVNNAIKFTSQGEVFLKVTVEDDGPDQAVLKFAVRDTGIGISKEDIGKLFTSFHQVDASTTRKFGGTGLGLAISKHLTELMDGQIGVESQVGKGSTFWFTARFKKQKQATAPVPQLPEDLAGKRVLIVDDNKTNLQILQNYLEHWGFVCDSAWSGEMALTMMRAAVKYNAPYDLLITDLQMPEFDGVELGHRVKSDADLQDIIMLMLSSRGLRGDAAKMRKIGFAGYLTKPVRRSQLYNCILMAFSHRAREDESCKPPLVTRHVIKEAKKQNFRILLVEDNKVNQVLALRLLQKWGFNGEAVANGQEAIHSLSMIPYDLVLMDVQMPVMDGLEATRRIRSGKTDVINPRVPIIAMTAHAMKGDRQRCLDAGMDHYLSKPINPDALLEVLEKYLPQEETCQ